MFAIILKRKRFATLTKMLVLFFGPQQPLSDNAMDKSLYLLCIQHKNQNGVAYGCRAATLILRRHPIIKSDASLLTAQSQAFFTSLEGDTMKMIKHLHLRLKLTGKRIRGGPRWVDR